MVALEEVQGANLQEETLWCGPDLSPCDVHRAGAAAATVRPRSGPCWPDLMRWLQ